MNRTALAVLCLSLLGSPLHAKKAAEPPKKPAAAPKPAKAATLSDLVALVMKSGKEWSSNSTLNTKLGYTSPQTGKKFPSPQDKDGYQRGLVVTTDETGAAKDIIFMFGRYSKTNGVIQMHESLNFRTDLSGNVLAAVSITGVKEAGQFVIKDPQSDEVKNRAKTELAFHLKRVK